MIKLAWPNCGGRFVKVSWKIFSIEQNKQPWQLCRLPVSPRIIDRFFKPFLGGVFLERELETSSRMFEFVMRMFSTGDATLPAHGMQAIPDQLAASLPKHSIRLNTAAAKVDEQNVVLASGEVITARAVVLATPATVTANLLHDPLVPTGRGVYCYYFAAERPPLSEPVLVLNGDDQGPIQNACVPSQVCPSYARWTGVGVGERA